MEEANTNIA